MNETMVQEMEKAERGEHASNLGSVIAYTLGRELGIPAIAIPYPSTNWSRSFDFRVALV